MFRRILFAVTALMAMWSMAPGHAAPPLEAYGRLPAFERAALSPSGERIALVGMIQGERRLMVVDAANKPLLVKALGERKVSGLYWAGEGQVLLQISETVALVGSDQIEFTTDKAELDAVIVIAVNGGASWSVFDGVHSITGGVRGFYGAIERDGRWYGYFGGITYEHDYKTGSRLGSTDADLYEVDLTTHKPRRIARRLDAERYRRSWLLGPNGDVAASFDFNSVSGAWRLHNPAGTEIAAGTAPTGGVGLVSLGRSANTIVYLDRDSDEVAHLYEIPTAGGAAVELLGDEQVNGFHLDPRSRQLIGFQRDGDLLQDIYFDKRRDRLAASMRKAFPGVQAMIMDSNDAFDRLLVLTSGSDDPNTWWLVDLKTGGAEDIGVDHAIASRDVGPVRIFAYQAGDGLAISGVLTLPPGRAPRNLPVIVLPHGGPAARDYPMFNWWAQAYASRGYAVFQPNFRGSTGISLPFQKAGHGEWGRKMQTDISDGLAALARDGIVDAKRACIVGASYGGYAALAGVTLQQGLYRCAVSVAGVADVHRMVTTDIRESGRDPTLIRALKAEVGSGRDLKMVSPVNFAERADAPILLIHGIDDTVVPFAQSRAMASALVRAGKPVELLQLDGEDHGLSRSETRLAMLKAAVAFVEKHNPPDPAPAAAAR